MEQLGQVSEEMGKRDQFTFYRSFWEALKSLPKKDQLPFVMAICSYVFERECKQPAGSAAAAFLLVKPILEKANKKAASGKLGGSKQKANAKQTESKQKQTESHIEGEREEEREIEKDIYPPSPLRGQVEQKSDIPALDDVLEAAKIMGCPEIARPFFDYYSAGHWRDSEGKPVKSWRQKLTAWKVRNDDKLRKQLAAGRENAGVDYDPDDWSECSL